LKRLARLWLESAEKGVVLGIVPFKAILSQYFWGAYSSPPCGAGVSSFSVLTSGEVVLCPIAVYESWSKVGRVEDLEELIPRSLIGEPCQSCNYFHLCGGRCLYAYVEKLWGEEGFREVCLATRGLIEVVLSVAPRIRELLEEGVISKEKLYYPPFNNTVEVIP